MKVKSEMYLTRDLDEEAETLRDIIFVGLEPQRHDNVEVPRKHYLFARFGLSPGVQRPGNLWAADLLHHTRLESKRTGDSASPGHVPFEVGLASWSYRSSLLSTSALALILSFQ